MDSAGAHRGDLEFEPRGVWSPAHPRRIAGRGRRVGHKRVARLMQQAGSERAGRHRWARATTRGEATRPAPALVERDISATGPTNWVADITYVPTWAEFLCLAGAPDRAAGSWAGRWPVICADTRNWSRRR